jgi:CheY-like chemotaxis protein
LPAGPAGPLDILVIEDDPVSQEVAAGLLQAGGHKVTLVDRGAAALAALGSRGFDAVLLDLHLPVMDGLEIAGQIRKLSGARRAATPILAVTVDVTAESRERCAGAGIDAVLAKPILRPVLEAALSHLPKGQALPAAGSGATDQASGLLLDRDYIRAQLDVLGPARLVIPTMIAKETALSESSNRAEFLDWTDESALALI